MKRTHGLYTALDSFTRERMTWTSFHPQDERRFYVALSEIVGRPDFNAEEMGSYLEDCYVSQFGKRTEELERLKNHYVDAATVIREYVMAIRPTF